MCIVDSIIEEGNRLRINSLDTIPFYIEGDYSISYCHADTTYKAVQEFSKKGADLLYPTKQFSGWFDFEHFYYMNGVEPKVFINEDDNTINFRGLRAKAPYIYGVLGNDRDSDQYRHGVIFLPYTFAANYSLSSDGFSYSFAQICSYKFSFAHPIKATLPELKCHISVKSKISIK